MHAGDRLGKMMISGENWRNEERAGLRVVLVPTQYKIGFVDQRLLRTKGFSSTLLLVVERVIQATPPGPPWTSSLTLSKSQIGPFF